MSTSASPPGVTVIDHPLIRIRLTKLRDLATTHRDFRDGLHEIAQLMIFELTRHLETRPVEVATPLATARGHVAARPIVVIPILRAGLGMLRGMLQLLPEARVGHIGMFRDEQTLEPVTYYCKLPSNINDADVFLVDPMLATGNSSADAVRQLKEKGVTRITFLSLLSCPEGIAHFRRAHADVPIFTAAIDERIDDRGYIFPGLGDAGDRYFGTQ